MVTLDTANCFDGRIGDAGLDPDDLAREAGSLAELTRTLADRRGTGMERWRDLPFDPMRTAHLEAVRAQVERLRPGTDTLIVLGIGGSALGNIALQSALNPSFHDLLPPDRRPGPRLFVLDNIDPPLIRGVLDVVRSDDPGLERTVVNVISKSGETAETAALFLLLRSLLRESAGADHAARVVAVTDSEQGTMRAICEAEGYARLPVPDGVGGRFSVLSPVGLFSAAMCGIDVDGLLDGAAAMDERCRGDDAAANPALMLAWVLVRFAERGRTGHVLMPYSSRLAHLADWYRQLWAESLGKRRESAGTTTHVGPTPIADVGPTDQHSQLQLYLEGPPDKVVGFVEIEDHGPDLTIPADLAAEPLEYLQGQTLGALLAAERRATEFALTSHRRPSYTLRLPALDAPSIGAFIQLWQVATAYAGLMLGVNAYDQPAVELGKLATFGLMGRRGYEEWGLKARGEREA
jgi:glucose-6-phosphate isomerase